MEAASEYMPPWLLKSRDDRNDRAYWRWKSRRRGGNFEALRPAEGKLPSEDIRNALGEILRRIAVIELVPYHFDRVWQSGAFSKSAVGRSRRMI